MGGEFGEICLSCVGVTLYSAGELAGDAFVGEIASDGAGDAEIVDGVCVDGFDAGEGLFEVGDGAGEAAVGAAVDDWIDGVCPTVVNCPSWYVHCVSGCC